MNAIVLSLLDHVKWCKHNEDAMDYMDEDDDMTIDLIPPLHYNIPPLLLVNTQQERNELRIDKKDKTKPRVAITNCKESQSKVKFVLNWSQIPHYCSIFVDVRLYFPQKFLKGIVSHLYESKVVVCKH